VLWKIVLSASSGEKKRMEATGSSTALVPIYQTAWHNLNRKLADEWYIHVAVIPT
jgi:hypothetical protein